MVRIMASLVSPPRIRPPLLTHKTQLTYYLLLWIFVASNRMSLPIVPPIYIGPPGPGEPSRPSAVLALHASACVRGQGP